MSITINKELSHSVSSEVIKSGGTIAINSGGQDKLESINVDKRLNESILSNKRSYLEEIRNSRNFSLFDTLKLNKQSKNYEKPQVEREITCPSIIDMAKISNRPVQNLIERDKVSIKSVTKYKDFKPGNVRK